MSYILDALRKADAERERGAVPDLHAQLLPPGSLSDEAESAVLPVGRWLAIGVGLIVVAGAGWWMLGRDDPAPPVVTPVPPPLQPASAASPATVPELATAPPPAASVPASAPEAARTEEPARDIPAKSAKSAQSVEKAEKSSTVAAARPSAAPKTAAATAEKPAPKESAPVRKKEAAPPPQPPRAEAPPQPVAPPKAEAPVRLPMLSDLPPELRQMVPPMTIGGSVYSPQASARMVVINGQVFQEGSALGPELRLEQIRQKTAVLSVRGTRFEVPL